MARLSPAGSLLPRLCSLGAALLMTAHANVSLQDFLANEIRETADDIVEEWIEWVAETASLRPARMLPRAAIRDHIPEAVLGVAEALRGPVEQSGTALAALKSHARLRHDQGYDIEELLKEYRGLTNIVGRRMLEGLDRYPGEVDARAVAETFLRLSDGLAAISGHTTSVYRNTEIEQRRELHQQLEDYVRTVTHELKQPLHAITAGADMLEGQTSKLTTERRARYLRMIRDGIERSSKLIDDIRNLVIFEGAQQMAEWQSLETTIVRVSREMEEQARGRGVRIEIEHPLPPIELDATRAEIALVNLVSNGIKYADRDKPDRWVRISAAPEEHASVSHWRITVRDNGLGIPDHAKPQIFERHFRAHPNVEEGTGLGLAIARRIVEQGGGSMSFESREGEGSEFHVVLPASPGSFGVRESSEHGDDDGEEDDHAPRSTS